jgi:5-methylthioadenosine/S-adenosylhomocysteine deaminase
MKVLLADYVLPITSPPIEKGAVVVEGRKIKFVGKASEIKIPGAQRKDFGRSVLMPGFVNAHSHLELTFMRNKLSLTENNFLTWLLTLTQIRKQFSEEEIELSALLGAIEGIKAGVTCFADVGNIAAASFKALKKLNLRGVVYQETNFSPLNSSASADFERLQEKFLTLKQNETELVRAGMSPHAPYTVSRKLFEKIAQYAIDEKVPIMIHAAESRDEISFLLKGEGVFAEIYKRGSYEWNPPRKRVILYLQETGILDARPLLAHCVHLTDEEIACIFEKKCKVAHCPRSNARFGHGIAPLEKFLDTEVPCGIGTDSVISSGNSSILQEGAVALLLSRLYQERKRFIKPEEIIKLSTIGGAYALGLEDEIGSLEAGKQADIIAISLDSIYQQPVLLNNLDVSSDIYSCLLFASQISDVIFTMVSGKELYSDGKLLIFDENEVKNRIIKALKFLRGI